MSDPLRYASNQAGLPELLEHLESCASDFTPPLANRVDVAAYAQRIFERSVRFEAWSGTRLVGLVAAYCNDPARRTSFVTSVSVLRGWQGRAIASSLMDACLRHAAQAGFQCLELEVDPGNVRAIGLYEKMGMRPKESCPGIMQLSLKGSSNGEPPEL